MSELLTIPVEKIVPNPEQPRVDFDPAEIASLAESIQNLSNLRKEYEIYEDILGRKYLLSWTHWLLYTERNDYVARVDLLDGIYRWVAFMYDFDKRKWGIANDLRSAQKSAQSIVEAGSSQLNLF